MNHNERHKRREQLQGMADMDVVVELVIAIEDLSDNVGKWLGAVAEAIVHSSAVSTPELVALKDKLTKLKTGLEELAAAIQATEPEL